MLAPNGGINHKLFSSKELIYASKEMHKNAPKAEIKLFFIMMQVSQSLQLPGIYKSSILINRSKSILIDEYTSVVDRDVAKAMSNAVQKYIRRTNKKIILASCHYDIMEWLQPDWIYSPSRGVLEKKSDGKNHLSNYELVELKQKLGTCSKNIII